MAKIIGAPTLDGALSALGETVSAFEARGEKTLIFCEDRLTLLAERAVLKGRGGTFLTEVSTFRRFLSDAKKEEKTVTKQGSVLAVAALLREHEGELRCFKRRAAQSVYETLAQLAASRVDADMLRRGAEETDGTLKEKLSDLALLLEAYGAFLREKGLLDENGYLSLLPAKISKTLQDTNVVFFAFPSFTRQAREGVRAALSSCKTVTGIFLFGREEFYTNEGARIFQKTAEEMGEVVFEERPSDLTGDAAYFAPALFSLGAPRDRKETTHVLSLMPLGGKEALREDQRRGADTVAWTTAPQDEYEEMERVAVCIKKFVSEGRRYRDITVLVGGEVYFPAAEKAFRAYGIPYYADVKRKFSEHPFCKFVLDVLEAVADGVLPEEADAIAASPYFGERGEHPFAEAKRIGNYRNYLLRYCGYRGGAWRKLRGDEPADFGDQTDLARCRERMLGILGCFKEVRRKAAEGRVFTAAVKELRAFVGEGEITAELKEELPEEERAFLDSEKLDAVLEEAEDLVGDRLFTVREFTGLFRSALEAFAVSVIPQRADAVFVGDITESRVYRSPVLFCAGLTDALPRVAQDTAVITDGELSRLGELEVEIDPAIAVVNARAREGLALNLLSFSDLLIVSRPLRVGSRTAAESEVLESLQNTFDVAPMPEVYPYQYSASTPARLQYFRDVDALATERETQRGDELIARYSSAREVLKDPAGLDWEPYDPDETRDRSGKEDVPEAGEFWRDREISPTALEEYFACPYRGFALKALRLTEREERNFLDSADAGTFVHAVLEHVARDFNDIPDEETCRARAVSEAERLLKEPRYAAITETAAGKYTGERLIREASEVTREAFRQLKCSSYRVFEAEAEVSIPSLSVKGKADRVDESGELVRVIDYKTGEIKDDVLSYYTGRSLQLELYLRAVSEGRRAAGAFYFPAADDFVSEKEGDSPFRMKGFYCKDPEVVAGLDTVRGEGKSEIFESGSKKALPREAFEAFLDYGLLVSEQAKNELGVGNIDPSPYEKVCKYCKLKGLCGFSGVPRAEAKMEAAELADIAKRAKEEGHGDQADGGSSKSG